MLTLALGVSANTCEMMAWFLSSAWRKTASSGVGSGKTTSKTCKLTPSWASWLESLAIVWRGHGHGPTRARLSSLMSTNTTRRSCWLSAASRHVQSPLMRSRLANRLGMVPSNANVRAVANAAHNSASLRWLESRDRKRNHWPQSVRPDRLPRPIA